MQQNIEIIRKLALEYNKEEFFVGDPIIFPKHFAHMFMGKKGVFEQPDRTFLKDAVRLADIEIAGIIAAHLAWGRRDMIVRDCTRALDEMKWQPYNYVMAGKYKDGDASLHRTIKWSDFAAICGRLREFYSKNETLENLSAQEIRVQIYGQKEDPKAANKKIHMFRRWMVRNDGVVDLGLWKNTSPASLVIPLDVHVHRSARKMGLTRRKGADIVTAMEITECLKEVCPNDPCIGDFALFAYAATTREKSEKKEKTT